MIKNHIVKEMHSNIHLFADDNSLCIVVDFPDSAAQILNLDLERLDNWAVKWLVKEFLAIRRAISLNKTLILFC